MSKKVQRIRDPLHNLIEFDSSQFEQTLWGVIQTSPFQRLRRVGQLGFSDLTYPGATHTRFAHSIGAFHTARQLMRIVKQHTGGSQDQTHEEKVALAAALVHDVGHGMFSHAFEEIGKKLNLKMAKHEHVSDWLIRNGEIKEAFAPLGSGFANDVADVISRGRPSNFCDAVVSSQFDADRLDYMQRDRLMTGVQNSGIDFVWLMNNLEIAEVPIGADDEQSGTIQTFVLGSKAIHAAETYVLALFQLYPTIYFHKTTRGAEKLFSAVMMRIFELATSERAAQTGLSANHPILGFAREPKNIEHALALDDTVFWGALPMLKESSDPLITQFSKRLWNRDLLKSIDIRAEIKQALPEFRNLSVDAQTDRKQKIDRMAVLVEEKLEELLSEKKDRPLPAFLIDKTFRKPYKFQDSSGLLNQISIRDGEKIVDVADVSPMIATLEPFHLLRIYYDKNHSKVKESVLKVINETIRSLKK